KEYVDDRIEGSPRRRRFDKFLIWKSRTDLENVTKYFYINSALFLIQLEQVRRKVFNLGDGVPELLHIYFQDFSYDKESWVKRRECKSIQDNLISRLEEENARRHGKLYNWETAKYGKIWYDEDVHKLRSDETEFPAIDAYGAKDAQGQSVFTSRAWKRLFDIRGSLVHELNLEFFSTFKFEEGVLDLDTARALQLIACSIVRRSQAPEKVTMTDLIYLRGIDVGSVNVPYLLARYLRLFASGRKQCAMIVGDQFVACLAEHFRLLTEVRLQELMAIMRDLPIIDMAEFVRLQICMKLDDTWDSVAPEPERHPDAVTGASEGAEDGPVADEGARLFQHLCRHLSYHHLQLDQLRLWIRVIMEYLVKISKKARILKLKRRHLKITVWTTHTPYPSRKIRRICACTSQKTTKETRSIRRIQERPICRIQAIEIKYSRRY
nr:hypothetical protein [Tanacetum cinerariifolium]